jgi:hypothetical protein
VLGDLCAGPSAGMQHTATSPGGGLPCVDGALYEIRLGLVKSFPEAKAVSARRRDHVRKGEWRLLLERPARYSDLSTIPRGLPTDTAQNRMVGVDCPSNWWVARKLGSPRSVQIDS